MTGRLPKRVLEVLGIGVVVSMDRIEEYQISGRLPEAQEALKNEISARQGAFGPEHRSLARLMMDMAMVLKARNQPKEAERIQKDVVDILTKSFGDRHPSALLAKVNLASTLADEGWLKRAEELQHYVQPILAEVLGPEHPETLTALQILATTLVSQGKYKEAEKTLRDVASSRTKILTKTHPQTIKVEISLVAVLRVQGLLNQASDLMNNIDEKIQNALANDQLTKASLFISQAELYNELGLLDKATEKSTAALQAIEKLDLAKDDSLRLNALEGIASIYRASWMLKEEEDILRKVLHIKSSLDESNPWLLSTKTLLAKNLLSQNLLDEASDIAKGVLNALETSAEVYTENYLACIDVLASSLFLQGKKDEAEEKRLHLLSSCEEDLGKSHPFTLGSACYLGEFYADHGAYDKAEELYIPVLQRFRALQQLGKDAVKVATLLAVAIREQGKYESAENLCEETITWCEEAFGEDHIETLQVYDILGRTYLMRDKRSDAEKLYVTKLEKQSQGTELEIYVKNNMAELKRQQGQFEAAEGLMLEALKLTETKHGKLHPTSVKMAGNLLGSSLGEHLTTELEEMALGTIVAKERLYGVTHPSTIKTMSDLAYAYGEHGRFEDARRLYKRIEDAGGLEALEQSNPSRYAIFCGKLADLYFREEQFETAQALEERALSVRKQIYGDSHRATLVSMANLASTLHAQKKYAEASVYLRRTVTVREETVKADPHSILFLLKSKSNLAANLFFQDQFEEAAELYRDILEISQIIGVDAAIMDVWRADFGKVLEKLPQQELPRR
jgi:tetratricopeptide (TPR) repeat protein